MTRPFLLATFNANSLRARLHILGPWMEENRPDLLCIQETKVRDEEFPDSFFDDLGYNVAFKGQKSYNGVAVASRYPIEDVEAGFGDGGDSEQDQARLLRCTVEGVRIVNTYVPQGREVGHEYFAYKLKWFERLRALFEREYAPDEDLVWCGDMNVAPEPRDVYDPGSHAEHVCFHEDVRSAFRQVVAWGFVDVFRKFDDRPGQYTFYDYRQRGALSRGQGWRIDHILATRPMAERAVRSWIDLEPRRLKKPSDHTFLLAEFVLP